MPTPLMSVLQRVGVYAPPELPPLVQPLKRERIFACHVCREQFLTARRLGHHLTTSSHGYYPPKDYSLRAVRRFAWLPVRIDRRWRWRCHYLAIERFEPDGQWTTGIWVPVSAQHVSQRPTH